MNTGLESHTVEVIGNGVNWLLAEQQLPKAHKVHDTDFVRHGLQIVEIMLELSMDDESLIAALLYPYYGPQATDKKLKEKITNKFGNSTLALLDSVRKMANLGLLSSRIKHSAAQAEKIRRMLTAMVEDVRAVVYDILRHRIGVTYEAEAENISSVDIINKIVNEIEVP